MLEIKNLTKYFYDYDREPFLALKDVSLTVDKGDIVCIVGPSEKHKVLCCKPSLDFTLGSYNCWRIMCWVCRVSKTKLRVFISGCAAKYVKV